jgi:fumarate reductase subunit D
MMRRARNHPAWWAFLVHRVSGIALAVFLPAHFLALGTALQGEARLDAFLRWTEQPAVIASEWGLVILLAARPPRDSRSSRGLSSLWPVERYAG